MENKEQKLDESTQSGDISELLSLISKKEDITVRDDQFGFPALLDAVHRFRDRRHRFRLIDTGRLSSFELEWLTAGGADLFTSDTVRSNAQELEFVSISSKRGNALVALFCFGDIGDEEQRESYSMIDWINLGRSGVFVHVSNKNNERDLSVLVQLADSCRKGGSWLVYYHHGSLETNMISLAQNGTWIHISDLSLADEESQSIVRDITHSALSSGGKLVLHWEKGVSFSLLEDIVRAGGVVLFKPALFDFKSPFRILEEKAKGRKLDYRAYYLYPDVLP